MPTDPETALPEPWRNPRPRPDARRLDDYVADEARRLRPLPEGHDPDDVPVRRRGEPMPPSVETSAYRAWVASRAAAP